MTNNASVTTETVGLKEPRPAMFHELKTWPIFFEHCWSGRKTFELRKDDRDFRIHDRLILMEFDPETKEYSGRLLQADVGYILRDTEFGLAEDYCILGLANQKRL